MERRARRRAAGVYVSSMRAILSDSLRRVAASRPSPGEDQPRLLRARGEYPPRDGEPRGEPPPPSPPKKARTD